VYLYTKQIYSAHTLQHERELKQEVITIESKKDTKKNIFIFILFGESWKNTVITQLHFVSG